MNPYYDYFGILDQNNGQAQLFSKNIQIMLPNTGNTLTQVTLSDSITIVGAKKVFLTKAFINVFAQNVGTGNIVPISSFEAHLNSSGQTWPDIEQTVTISTNTLLSQSNGFGINDNIGIMEFGTIDLTGNCKFSLIVNANFAAALVGNINLTAVLSLSGVLYKI